MCLPRLWYRPSGASEPLPLPCGPRRSSHLSVIQQPPPACLPPPLPDRHAHRQTYGTWLAGTGRPRPASAPAPRHGRPRVVPNAWEVSGSSLSRPAGPRPNIELYWQCSSLRKFCSTGACRGESGKANTFLLAYVC